MTTRNELAVEFGGSTQGGIVKSKRSATIFLFSDPAKAVLNGYNFDGRTADATAFNYTGEGLTGDQYLRRGNKSLLNHAQDGFTVRLFVAAGLAQRQEVAQQYVGEFAVDSKWGAAYQHAKSSGTDGLDRTVIVFRLLPVGQQPGLRVVAEPHDAIPTNTARLVKLEVDEAYLFQRPAVEAGDSARKEAALTKRFRLWLEEHDRKAERWSIPVPGTGITLLSDIYLTNEYHLFEAKASASRASVRLAIGQLLDYSRHLSVPALARSVLLPERPEEDLLDLLSSLGLGCTVGQASGFETILEPVRATDGALRQPLWQCTSSHRRHLGMNVGPAGHRDR